MKLFVVYSSQETSIGTIDIKVPDTFTIDDIDLVREIENRLESELRLSNVIIISIKKFPLI